MTPRAAPCVCELLVPCQPPADGSTAQVRTGRTLREPRTHRAPADTRHCSRHRRRVNLRRSHVRRRAEAARAWRLHLDSDRQRGRLFGVSHACHLRAGSRDRLTAPRARHWALRLAGARARSRRKRDTRGGGRGGRGHEGGAHPHCGRAKVGAGTIAACPFASQTRRFVRGAARKRCGLRDVHNG